MLFKDIIPDSLMVSESITRRNHMYDIYKRFYMGKHWKDELERGAPQLTFNYCKAFVDKSVAFLISNGFKINVEDKKKEKKLNEVWKENDKELLSLEIVQAGSVLGDVWVKVGYNDTEKKIYMKIINSAKVLPEFEKLNSDVLKKIRIVNHYEENGKKKIIVEHISKDTLYEEIDGKVHNERENTLGIIPVIHIRNTPIPFNFYGRSDVEPILSLNKEYNEKATDLSEALDYQGSPVVIIKGAKAKNLERGANKVWGGLPVDSSVELLSLSGGLDEMKQYLLSLKQAMHEMAGVPEEALGKTQPISNTSGVALDIRYRPLIEKTKIKKKTYGKGFEDINKCILKTLEVKEGLKNKDYVTEVIFESPFPKDRTVVLQNYETEIRMGVESRKNVAKLLGKDNLEELMAEIQREKEDDEAVAFNANQVIVPPLKNEEEIK